VQASAVLGRLSIRGVLLLGLCLTLCLWLFSGYYFSRRISELQQQSTRVTARYVRAQARMSAVRSQVLLASVYVRDALLDPDPESIVDYRMKLDAAFAIIDRSLAEYEPVINASGESTRVQQMRRQIGEFQAAILDVLQSDSTRWQSHALTILRDRIMPKREQAVEVSEDVQSINRSAYIDQQSATTKYYRVAQQRIWTQFGLAIAASFFIGLFAIRHVAGMERQLRQQQQRDARTSADLQRLSAQLISAQEEERRTIARELHDEIGQALTAIKVELALAERAIGVSEPPGQALHTVRNLTEGALHTVRDLSRLLHPAVLDDIGLAAALHAYVRDFRKRYDMEVEFDEQVMECRLPADAEAAAYRIVQEALTNVARHAAARSCRVTLRRRDDEIEIAVEDDGTGFDPEAQRESISHAGLGLLGMRERAVRLGGRCIVDSAPGRGTRVVVSLPLHDQTLTGRADRPAGSVLFGHFADA
jgi:signal transduction histidine kinase